MEIQAAQGTGMLKSALEQQELGASLITSTIDRLNTGMRGMTPVVDANYDMQKTVLNAAYAERGVGTRLDITI